MANRTSRTKNSARNAVWGITEKIISMVFSFIARTYIIHTIGAEFCGVGGLFKSILTMLNMSELGFSSAIVFLMYRSIAENDTESINSLLTLLKRVYQVITIGIAIIGLCVIPFLSLIVKNDTGVDINLTMLYLIYLIDIVSSYAFVAYRSCLFTAYQRQDIITKITCLFSVIQYITQFIVLIVTKNYYLYVLVMSLFTFPKNLALYLYSKRRYPQLYCSGKINQEQWKSVWSKVRAIFGHRLGGTLIISVDGVVISAMLGVSALTKYDNYYYIYSSIVIFLNIIRTSMTASIGNKLCLDCLDDVYAFYKKITLIWMCLISFCTASLLTLFQPFAKVWLGERLMFENSVIYIMVIYFFCWQFRKINETMHSAAGMWEKDQLKPYIGTVMNLILSFIFVKITGSIVGVLLPTIFIMIAVYMPWEIYILFKYVFKRSCKDYLIMVGWACGAAIISSLFTYALSSFISLSGFLDVLVKALLCVCIPTPCFVLFCIRMPEMRQVLGMMGRNISCLSIRHK